MKIKITVEFSGLENSAPSESAGELNAIWHSLKDLDRGLAETNGRIDSLKARSASGEAGPSAPIFDSEVDDSEL